MSESQAFRIKYDGEAFSDHAIVKCQIPFHAAILTGKATVSISRERNEWIVFDVKTQMTLCPVLCIINSNSRTFDG